LYTLSRPSDLYSDLNVSPSRCVLPVRFRRILTVDIGPRVVLCSCGRVEYARTAAGRLAEGSVLVQAVKLVVSPEPSARFVAIPLAWSRLVATRRKFATRAMSMMLQNCAGSVEKEVSPTWSMAS
jgi:hypothetical protein